MLNIEKSGRLMPTAHRVSDIGRCRIIELARHRHDNGSLTVVENSPEFPFELKRVFYLYDVPAIRSAEATVTTGPRS